MPMNAEAKSVDALRAEVAALRAELATMQQEHAAIVEAVAVFRVQLREAIDLARETLTRVTAQAGGGPLPEENDVTPPTPQTIRSAYQATREALAACAHTDPAEQLAELCIALREQPGPTRLHALLLARAVQGGLQLGELLESEDVAATIARHANRPTRGTGTVPPSGTGEGEE